MKFPFPDDVADFSHYLASRSGRLQTAWAILKAPALNIKLFYPA
jgi:hypothetical protein